MTMKTTTEREDLAERMGHVSNRISEGDSVTKAEAIECAKWWADEFERIRNHYQAALMQITQHALSAMPPDEE